MMMIILSVVVVEILTVGKYSEQPTRSGGMTLPWVLTVIFCVLQFVGVIDWSWYWLISPLWISLGLAVSIIVCILIVSVVAELVAKLLGIHLRKMVRKASPEKKE